MEGKRKEKVTLDLCSVCWQGSAYPYGCFHYLEPQADVFYGCERHITVKWSTVVDGDAEGTSKVVLASEGRSQQIRASFFFCGVQLVPTRMKNAAVVWKIQKCVRAFLEHHIRTMQRSKCRDLVRVASPSLYHCSTLNHFRRLKLSYAKLSSRGCSFRLSGQTL